MRNKQLPTLAPHDSCTGCMACGEICPTDAISFQPDKEKFLYPSVEADVCVRCYKCMDVCPIVSESKDVEANAPRVYASWAKGEGRLESASGGVFYALAERVIIEGGYACGAVFDGRSVKHIITNDISELHRIQGTKYQQSDVSGCYKRIRELLKADQKVIFGGTSCQVAGLMGVVGHKTTNLITVDLVCYGVPSPLNIEVEEKMRGKKLTRIISNRDKKHQGGWLNAYHIICEWEDGSITDSLPEESFIFSAFNSGKTMRLSCYNCQFKHVDRQSDITIGDFSGIRDYKEEWHDGISLVITHTSEGDAFLNSTQGLTMRKRSIKDALLSNRTLYSSDKIDANRWQRKYMSQLYGRAPLWFLKWAYVAVCKSANPLLWPMTLEDLWLRRKKERQAIPYYNEEIKKH